MGVLVLLALQLGMRSQASRSRRRLPKLLRVLRIRIPREALGVCLPGARGGLTGAALVQKEPEEFGSFYPKNKEETSAWRIREFQRTKNSSEFRLCRSRRFCLGWVVGDDLDVVCVPNRSLGELDGSSGWKSHRIRRFPASGDEDLRRLPLSHAASPPPAWKNGFHGRSAPGWMVTLGGGE